MWSGGTYTKSNAGTGGWTGDAVAGIAIDATRHDTQDNDFATGINQCLTKDGQNQCTADLNFGGFRPSNVAGGSAAAPSYTANNDTDTGAFSPAANTYGIATGGVERARVDSAGNLGVGTTAPVVLVHAHNAAGTSTLKLTNPTTGVLSTDGLELSIENTTNDAFLNNRENAGLYLRTNNTNRVAIAADGKVGINFVPPQTRLHVGGAVPGTAGAATNKGTVQIDEAGVTALTQDGGLEFKSSQTGSGYGSRIVGFDDGSLIVARRVNAATWTESMRVDTSGRVGIGAPAPLTPLNVTGQANDTDGTGSSQGQVIIQDSDNATSGLVLGYRYQTSVAEYARIQTILGTALAIQAGGGNVGIGLSNPAYRLQLSADSAAKPTTNTWTIASDARIKTNIQDYTKGLEEIKRVRPVTYDYNGCAGFPAGDGGISIIAQEIQSVFPECVGQFSAKLHPEDAEETQILNYNGHAVTFALINAVKELAAKVESLEARIAVLEGA
jgi:hypothetical protein